MNATATNTFDPSTATKYWVRWNWDAEANRIADMSTLAAGLFLKLRMASWARYGIPTNEEQLSRLLKFRCGMRMKMFRRLWCEMEHFFYEKDGFLFCLDDETERGKVVSIGAKRQKAGEEGARQRWNRPPDPEPEAMAIAIPDNNNRGLEVIDREEQQPQQPGRVEDVEEVEVPPSQTNPDPETPPEAPNSTPKTPAESADSTCQDGLVQTQVLTDQEYKEFIAHCQNPESHPERVSFTTPGRKLAERLKVKFKMPLASLPKFKNQQQASMWDSATVTPEQVESEIGRLKAIKENPAAYRKPPSGSVDYDNIRRNLEAKYHKNGTND